VASLTSNSTLISSDNHERNGPIEGGPDSTYSSNRSSVDGPLGFGWTHAYAFGLTLDGSGNATVSQATGAKTFFNWNSTLGTFSTAPRTIATLVRNGSGSYTLTQKDKSQLQFDATGRLTAEVDKDSYATNLAYDGAGHLQTVTDAAGRALTFTYEGTHIKQIQDVAGRVVVFTYVSTDLVSVADVGGGLAQYTYNAQHQLTNLKDAKCSAAGCPGTTNSYVGNQVTSQSDPLGRVTGFSYVSDGISSTTTITDPRGFKTQEEYLNGLLVSRTRALGTSLQATWTYQYDPATLAQTAVIDPFGRVATMAYDSQANLLTGADPLGRTTTYTNYNAFNEPQQVTDSLGVTTTYIYDSSGHLLSSSTPITGGGTATSSYGYDSTHLGDLLTTIDPENRVSHYTYDTNGYRTSATDPAGDKTTYVHDAIGRLSSQVAPLGNVTGGTPSQYTTGYMTNAFGNPLTVTDPLSHVTTYGYDANQNRTSVIDANMHATTYGYDFDNELTLMTRPDSSTQATVYDADGNVTQQVDALNHATVYGYDALNRKTSMADGLNRTTGYAYDLANNMTSMTDPEGHLTLYGYDSDNELTAISYELALPGNVTYGYDAAGRRTSMSDGTGSSTYQYDSLGRLTTSTNGTGAQIGYGFDRSSRLTSIAYPAGAGTISRGYDAAGRLSSVGDWLSHSTGFAYDANSELTTITYPNTVTAKYGYDRAGRLSSISDQQGTNSPFFGEADSRDGAGQLTGNGSQSYGYDTVNRVTSGGSQSFGYDAADRITAQTLSGGNISTLAYDTADQLATDTITSGPTQVQKYTYGYDARGNRTRSTDASSNVQSYGWDQANRMSSFSGGDHTASYAYNGDGLRTSKTADASSEAFTWDVAEGLPLIIQDGSTKYVTGPGGLPLEQINGSTVLYYHQDQLGSTRALTDSSGIAVATSTYDTYGNLSASTGTAPNPFGFGGQFTDAETGLIYLRARYYDAGTCQFISSDPALMSTRRPYSYALDTPLNGSDPTGLDFWASLQNGIINGYNSAHNYVTQNNQGLEATGQFLDSVSASFGVVELGCGAATALAAASIIGAEVVPFAGACAIDAAEISTVSLVVATGFHGAACWGGNHEACGNAVIDVATTLIPIPGNKAIEKGLEQVYGHKAVEAECDYLVNTAVDTLKKAITGS